MPSAVASLLDRLSQRLIRQQADSRFRDLATAFAPTRGVAQRRAGALFDLCAGFAYSQILLACVELDVPQHLLANTCDAQALGLTAQRTERLLLAAASLRIATRRPDGGFRLGPLGAALIDNPGVAAMIAHHRLLYDDLRDPVALLRGRTDTALSRFWTYARPDEALDTDAAAYSALMAASQRMIAATVLASYRVGRHRRLLDVGGGTGEFLLQAARRSARLELQLFDLPAVIALAKRRLAHDPQGARVAVFEGDAKRDQLPAGADLVTLIRVLHDHDDDQVLLLLRAVRRALAPDGRLLVAEPMSGTRGAEAAGDAYFGFYLLAMGSGQPRTPSHLRALLRSSGFGNVRLRSTHQPLLARMIVATA